MYLLKHAPLGFDVVNPDGELDIARNDNPCVVALGGKIDVHGLFGTSTRKDFGVAFVRKNGNIVVSAVTIGDQGWKE